MRSEAGRRFLSTELEARKEDEAELSAARSTEQLRQETGAAAVSIAESLDALKRAKDAPATAVREVAGHQFVQVGAVWVDRAYAEKMPTLTVKALGAAYFRILQLHPEAKKVLALGRQVVWVTPSGTALIVDRSGSDALSDEQIEKLFVEGTAAAHH